MRVGPTVAIEPSKVPTRGRWALPCLIIQTQPEVEAEIPAAIQRIGAATLRMPAKERLRGAISPY